MNKKKLCVLSVLLLVGCSNSSVNEEKAMNCKLVTNLNIMSVETNAKITYVDDQALKNTKTEHVIFYENKDLSSEEMTSFIEEYVKNLTTQKESSNALEGVRMDFTVKDSTIDITGEIDYSKINLEKMKEIDPNIEGLLNEKIISVSKLKESSEALGYVCTDLEVTK